MGLRKLTVQVFVTFRTENEITGSQSPSILRGGFVRCQPTCDLKLQASSCQVAVITIPPRGGGAYPIIALDQETVGRQPCLLHCGMESKWEKPPHYDIFLT